MVARYRDPPDPHLFRCREVFRFESATGRIGKLAWTGKVRVNRGETDERALQAGRLTRTAKIQSVELSQT